MTIHPSLTPKKNRKSPLSKVVKGLTITSIAALGIGSLMPMALSSRVGTKQLCKVLSGRLQGTLQIQSLSLSWLGLQEVEGVSFQDHQGRIFFSCQKVSSSSSLLKILFQKDISEMVIDTPHLKVKKSEISFVPALKLPMQKASLLSIPSVSPFLGSSLPLSGAITIKDGAIDFSMPGVDTLAISELSAALKIDAASKSAAIALDAQTLNTTGKGLLHLSAKLGAGGQKPELTLASQAQNLPIKALDQLAALFNPSLRGQLIDYLGDSLSLDIAASLSKSDADMQIKASSNTLEMSFYAKTRDGMFSLQAPSSCTLKLSNALLARLSPALQTSQREGGKVELKLSKLQMPLSSSGYDIDHTAIAAEVSISPLKIQGYGTESIDLSTIVLSATSSSMKQGVDFTLHVPVNHSSGDSKINASGTLLEPFAKPQVVMQALAQNMPSAILSGALKAPIVQEVLGDTFSLELGIDTRGASPQASLSMVSAGVKIANAKLLLQKGLILQAPCNIDIIPSKALSDRLFGTEGLIPSLGAIHIIVSRLELPSLSDKEMLTLSSEIDVDPILFQDRKGQRSLTVDKTNVSMSIRTLDNISIALSNNLINTSLQGAFSLKDYQFMITTPLRVECTASNDLLEVLMQGASPITLLSPTKALLELEHFTLATLEPMSRAVSAQGTARMEGASFVHSLSQRQIDAKDAKLYFDFRGMLGALSLALKAQLAQEGHPLARVDIEAKISRLLQKDRLDISEADIVSTIRLDALPVDTIGAWLLPSASLSQMIGSELTLEARIEKTKQQMSLSIDAKAPLTTVRAALIAKEGAIALKDKPAYVSITVTPSSQKEIDRLLSQESAPLPLVLQDSAKIGLEISKLYLPYQYAPCQGPGDTKCVTLGIKKAALSAKASASPLAFVDGQNKPSILIKTAKVEVDKVASAGSLKMAGYIEALNAAAKAADQLGKVSLQLDVLDLFDETASVSLDKVSSDVALQIEKIPTSMLDLFSRPISSKVGPFRAIFGPMLNATFSLKMKEKSGALALNVNTQSTRASLSGLVTNGILTLSEPIYAQVTMTPELSTFLLDGVNPLSISEIRSSNPITLEVPVQGFSLAIAPFSLSSVNIPSARIELGKVQCKNEGNLNIALSLLKSVQLSRDNVLNLWFTPIDLRIKQGVVAVERTDILIADTFDIALWGDIDPIKDRVDMVLGLTADTLSQAFSIKNLPKDYVLQVPMTGTLDNVKINTAKATAKVAALLAWQKAALAGGAAGGPAGAALGQLLSKVAQLPLNDRDTPPAKRPFPWEDGAAETKAPRTKAKGAHFKKGDKPLKQLWKVIK